MAIIDASTCRYPDTEIENIQKELLSHLRNYEEPYLIPELLKASKIVSKSAKNEILYLSTNIDSKEAVEGFFEILDSFNNSCYARYGNDGDYSVD